MLFVVRTLPGIENVTGARGASDPAKQPEGLVTIVLPDNRQFL